MGRLAKAVEWAFNVAGGLIGSWGAIMSALASVGTLALAYWQWGTQYGYVPILLAGLFASAGTIWVINGVVWLRRQRRPGRQRTTFDYSFGLALTGLYLGHDTESDESNLQLGLNLFNAAPGPLRYEVESFDVVIGDRTIARPNFANRGAILSRGCGAQFFYQPFARNMVPDRRTQGVIRYSIKYGHPEFGFSRRSKKELDVTMRGGEKPWVVYITRFESDEEI